MLALLLPGTFVLRATVFAPTFDVSTIRETPEYQDAMLLAHAWDQPVAATYHPGLVYQSNGSVCGPSSIANVMRSRGRREATESSVLSGSGQCSLGFCFMGLSLDQLAEVARHATHREVTVLRGSSLAEFRAELAHVNDPDRRYTINFHRGLLFGRGVGHHSPIGAYLADRDLVFVLDVNRDYQPWLASSERVWRAMDATDGSTGLKRGMLRIQ